MRVMNAQDVIQTSGLVVMVYGDPGIGKTTLANTAPNPIVLDFDKGSHRASLHKQVVQFESWSDMLQSRAQLDELLNQSDTIIVDTVGTLLDSIALHLVETQPMLAKNSIKLWGELKKAFLEFFLPLRAKNKNIVFIAHAKEKEENETRIKRPLIAGSSYDLLMQTCDLIGYYSMRNNVRTLTFDMSDTVVAKNCAGIPPLQIRSVATMTNLLGLILSDTRQALAKRTEQQATALQIVSEWQESATKLIESGKCTLKQVEKFMADLKDKSTDFPSGTSVAVWATVKPVFESAGFTWDAEQAKFTQAVEQ